MNQKYVGIYVHLLIVLIALSAIAVPTMFSQENKMNILQTNTFDTSELSEQNQNAVEIPKENIVLEHFCRDSII